MKNILLFILLSALLFGQSKKITGYVYDQQGKPIPGANIVLENTNFGAASESNGFFEIRNIDYGIYTLKVSSVGYKTESKKISFNTSYQPIKIYLQETAVQTDQVVVSAGKYEQKIEDLTVSTTVIPPQNIERRNFTKLDDVLRYVPGVSMALDQLSIRGSSGYSKGAGTRVLVAIDGVPIYTADTGEIIWEMVPLTDVERIEVIKGPASSLYGSTAIGGVINIITKKPSKKPIYHLSAHGGLYDKPSVAMWRWSSKTRTFYGGSAAHSNTIGNLGYTVSVKRINDDSYRENDYTKNTLVYLKMNYDLSSSDNISLLSNYLSMNRGNFLYWKDSRHALVPKDEDRDQIVKSDRLFFSFDYSHKFSDKFSLSLKPSYYYMNFDGIGQEITTSTSKLSRNEIIGKYTPSDNFTFIIGSEGTYAKVNSNLFENPNFYSLAGYVHTEYKGINKLTTTFGVRYDYIKIESIDPAHAVTPKAGLNYKLLSNLIMRASIGTGFRAPTPAEIFTTTSVGGINIEKNPDLTYETSLSFEVGSIYNPFDQLSIDAAFFQTDYNNFIEPNFTKDGNIKFINLPKARIQGLDLVVNFDIFPSILKLKTGYTYLWARDLEKNKPMKYRPRNRVYSALNLNLYPFEFGVYFRYWSRIEAIDESLVNPPINLIPEGDDRTKVFVWDLSASYNFNLFTSPMMVSINVKNLFNYNYVEFLGNLSPIRNFSIRIDSFF